MASTKDPSSFIGIRSARGAGSRHVGWKMSGRQKAIDVDWRFLVYGKINEGRGPPRALSGLAPHGTARLACCCRRA